MTTAVFEGDAFDGRTGGGAITLELLEVGPGKGAGAPPVRGVFLAPPEHTRRPDGSDEVQCRGAARREAAPEKTRFDLARALFAVAIAGSWPEPWVENLIGDRLLAFDDVVETDGDVIVEFTFRLVIPTSVPLPVLVHVTAFDSGLPCAACRRVVTMERHLVTKIATDAAITFKLREAFAQTNDATLARLLAHDERVEACLDALRIAGGAGFRAADAELSRGPEGAFPYAVLAIERGDDKALSQLFGRVERQPETAAVVASALAWADVVDAREVALTLADPSCAPALRRLGIDALGRSGSDAERAIEHALTDRDPGVAASAARAAGTLGRDDLLDVVSAGLGSSEVIVRRWSAWASVALGRRDVCDELWIWIAEGASDHVLFMAVAATSLEEANERLGRAVEVPPELVERPSEAELVGALRSAAQRSRRGAASALALAKPESPVFDVFAPAPRQVEKLARHFGGGPGLNRSLRKRWTWPSCT